MAYYLPRAGLAVVPGPWGWRPRPRFSFTFWHISWKVWALQTSVCKGERTNITPQAFGLLICSAPHCGIGRLELPIGVYE